MTLLFVGERRSNKAKQMGVVWSDGNLAAKPLFEALLAISIDPKKHQFVNWFEGGKAIVRKHDGLVVAMGNKVQAALAKEGIGFIPIIHPAARGAIRLRASYMAHIASRLGGVAQ